MNKSGMFAQFFAHRLLPSFLLTVLPPSGFLLKLFTAKTSYKCLAAQILTAKCANISTNPHATKTVVNKLFFEIFYYNIADTRPLAKKNTTIFALY